MSKPPSRGQHWLVDQSALARIASAAGLVDGHLVAEIGPGRGHLTDHLLKSPASRVLAIEIDPDLTVSLKQRYASAIAAGRLELELADCRRYDWSQLPTGWRLCANIPYYLTAFLLRQLTEIDNQPAVAVLLLPQPVAVKLASERGSLLATIVGAQYGLELLDQVPVEAFRPPPRVKSQVVRLTARGQARETPIRQQWPELCRFWRLSFARPRQSLMRNLQAGGYDRQYLSSVWADLGLSDLCRPAELDRGQWLALWSAVRPGPVGD